MSERSNVQSWNGCVRKRTPGSNPGLCAKNEHLCVLFYLQRTECALHTRLQCNLDLNVTLDNRVLALAR